MAFNLLKSTSRSINLINKAICLNGVSANQGGLYLNRNFHLTAQKLVSKEFEEAKNRLTSLKNDPGNEVKLQLYALFKQATIGACNAPKPGMMDFVGKAKWTAWSELGKMSKEDAEKKYIEIINKLLKGSNDSSADTSKTSASATNSAANNAQAQTSEGKYKEIITSIEYGNVYKIVLNRPVKKNAINLQMYNEIKAALSEADSNPNVSFCVFTGKGDYYSSGNDLSNFVEGMGKKSIKEMAKEGRDFLEEIVNSFINFSKPIVGVVNGHSVGISFTLLGLFDLVYAIDTATFHAPFTKLAQSPEACSSYIFPLLMGKNKASDILVFNRKITAQEAFDRNIVTEVIPAINFDKEVWAKIESFSKLPKQSFLASSRLIRSREKDLLRKINKEEVDVLSERWSSEEFIKVVTDFFSKKTK